MARSILSLTPALATATAILLGSGATPIYAQAATPATPTATAPRQKQYAEVEEIIQQLAKDRNMPAAIKALEEVGRKYPELPSAHVMMYGILAQNNPYHARLQLSDAMEADPSDPEPYVILGKLALQERRMPEASMAFDKAKQLLAGYTKNAQRKGTLEFSTNSGLAEVAETRERWKDAESALRDLLRLAPEDLVAQQRLARALFHEGKASDAYEVLKKAKEIDRANAKKNGTREVFLTPEAILAQYYDQYEGPTSKTGNAEKWFRGALAQAPGDLHTRQVVALWALRNGKLDFAKEQTDAAVKIEASDPKYSRSTVGRELRGLIALWEKKWENAADYFESVRLEAPNDFVARNNLALALVEQDDSRKKQQALTYAEANYHDVKKDTPDALDVLTTWGWVCYRRKDFDQAKLCLEQAINIKRTSGRIDPDTLTYYAHILWHNQQDWVVKVLLEDILKNDQPFSMRPEALELYKKVKDAKNPQAAPAAKTP